MPFTSDIFLAPDNGTPSGGGEGAGTALADPPVGGADDPGDVMSFKAPDADDVVAGITGRTPKPAAEPDPKSDATKGAAKPSAKPADKPPVKPDDKKGAEPPAAQLRRELETLKKERDELKTKLDAGDPRVKELTGQIEATKKELDEVRKSASENESRLAALDPRANRAVRELESKWEREYARDIEDMPNLDGAFKALVHEYARLPRKDGLIDAEALSEFKRKVGQLVDDGSARSAYDLVRRGYDFAVEHSELQGKVQKDAHQLAFDADKRAWTDQDARVASLIDGAKKVPDGLADSDPFHPRVVLNQILDAMPEEKRGPILAGIDRFVRQVFAGITPRSPADYPGMTPEQVKESRDNELSNFTKARESAVGVLHNGLVALRLMPSLVKEVKRLTELVEKKGLGTPPDPTTKAGDGSRTEPDDVKEYKAPSLDDVTF